MDFDELRCKVYKVILNRLTRKREFVFRFEYYDGNTKGNTIDDTQVVQYHFVNQGNSVIDINGMKLNPTIDATGVQFPFNVNPSSILMPIRENEMDVTVYKYKFLETIPDPAPPPGRIDSLLVIMKIKADIATNKKG